MLGYGVLHEKQMKTFVVVISYLQERKLLRNLHQHFPSKMDLVVDRM
jgi:hypothetical protein